MNHNHPPQPDMAAHSTLFERLDPEKRQQLNLAILDRSSGSYRTLYDQHFLDAFDISFSAFYRYARRLRRHAAQIEMAEWSLPLDKEVAAGLPTLLARHLIETLAFDNPTPRAVQRLADAYRMAVAALINHDRHLDWPSDNETEDQLPNGTAVKLLSGEAVIRDRELKQLQSND